MLLPATISLLLLVSTTAKAEVVDAAVRVQTEKDGSRFDTKIY